MGSEIFNSNEIRMKSTLNCVCWGGQDIVFDVTDIVGSWTQYSGIPTCLCFSRYDYKWLARIFLSTLSFHSVRLPTARISPVVRGSSNILALDLVHFTSSVLNPTQAEPQLLHGEGSKSKLMISRRKMQEITQLEDSGDHFTKIRNKAFVLHDFTF